MREFKPKILAPVSDFTTLRAAIDSGADEIYFGVKGFNMRATARNFELKDLPKIARTCHSSNVKALLALNVLVYDSETKIIRNIVKKAKKYGIDAIIAWDMSVINECIRQKMPVHLSTQNSISNYESLKQHKKNIPTLTRVVLARECTLEDIKKIINNIKKDKLDVEIETFAHGAMCVSVSGRCMLSHHLFGKSANRGECLQPCRRQYEIRSTDKLDSGNEFILGEDAIISPKDLCTLPFIEKLVDAGIDVLKIEGRNRNPEYVSTTVEAYKEVIKYYLENKKKIRKDKDARIAYDRLKEKNIERLKTVFNRGFSSGFYLGKPASDWSSSRTGEHTQMKLYVGKVLNHYPKINVAEVHIEDNTLNRGDNIAIHGPTTGHYELKVSEMKDEKTFIEKAVKGTIIGLKVDKKVRRNDQVYKLVEKK